MGSNDKWWTGMVNVGRVPLLWRRHHDTATPAQWRVGRDQTSIRVGWKAPVSLCFFVTRLVMNNRNENSWTATTITNGINGRLRKSANIHHKMAAPATATGFFFPNYTVLLLFLFITFEHHPSNLSMGGFTFVGSYAFCYLQVKSAIS